MNNIHPLVWVEVIEHALQLYECGEIEVEHLATVVRYVAKILGLLNVSDDVKRNPRRAVRHAVRIVDNYLKLGKTQIAPVIVSITLNDLVEMVKKVEEEESS